MKNKFLAKVVLIALLLQIFTPLWTGISYGLYNRPVLNIGDQIRIEYGDDYITSKGITLQSGNILKLVSGEPQINDFVLYERDYFQNNWYGGGGYWATEREIKVYNPHIDVNNTDENKTGWFLVGKVEKVADSGSTYKDQVKLSEFRYDVIRIIGGSVGPFPVNTYAQIVSTDYKVGDYVIEKYSYFGTSKAYFIRIYDGVSYPNRTILGKVESFSDYIHSYWAGSRRYYACLSSIPLEPNKYKFTRSVPIPTPLNSDYRLKGTPLMDNRVAFMNDGGEFYIFDPLTDSWEQKTSFPSYLINTQYNMSIGPDLTTLPNNKIIAGGSCGYLGTSYTSFSQRQSRDIFIYNVATDTWETRISNALDYYPVGKALAAIDNNRIVGIGGEDWTDSNWWTYNTYAHLLTLSPLSSTQATGNLNGSQGYGYSQMRAFKLPNGKFLALGGANRGYGSTNSRLFEYDSASNTIITKHDLYDTLGPLNYNHAGQYYTSQIGAEEFLIRGQESSLTFLYNYAKNSVGMIPILHEPWYGAVTARLQQAQRTPNGTVVFMGGDGYVWKAIPNTAPTVNITQPVNNQEVQKGKTLNIRWTASDINNDNLTYTVRVYNANQEFFRGAPNAGFNNTTGQHNFDTTNIPVTWDPTANRYESRIFVDVTAFDGTEGRVSTKEILLVNYNANAVVSTPATTHVVNYQDAFSLGLRVWHVGTGSATVSATINGKTRTATIAAAPSSMPSTDNVTLTWSGATALSPGTYRPSDIVITVINSENISVPVSWNGTIVVMDILTMVNDSLSKTLLNNDKDNRFVLINTESSIQNTARNTGLLQNIKNRLNGRNQNALWIGKPSSKNYIDGQLNLTNEYLYKSTPTDAKTNIIDFILSVITGNVNGDIFVVGDLIDTQMIFEDFEKDYEDISLIDKLKTNLQLDNEQKKPKTGTLQLKYTHNPNVFDNPIGVHDFADEEWHNITDINDMLVIKKALSNMRGDWTMTLQASDSTKNALFDKFATPKTKSFKIHTAPIAIAEKYETATELILSGEDSYDLDFQYSLPDNGIVRYEWYYELDNGTVIKHPVENKYVTLPKQVGVRNVVSFTLTVTDCFGAKGSTNVAGLITPELRAKLFPELSKFDIFGVGIPASEQLKVVDIETIPSAMDSVEFALYKGSTRSTPFRTLTNPTGLEIITPPYNKWKDIRNYVIPETLPDDSYTARIRAIQGSLVFEKTWNVRVNTPINLVPSMPSEVIIGESVDIRSVTSKYANAVSVTLFKGQPFAQIITLNGTQAGDIKNWIRGFTIPMSVPEGNYIAEFTATTPNGNVETKTLNFRAIIPLSITGEVDPSPVAAGYWVTITGYTEGYAHTVTATIKGDTYSMTPVDPTSNNLNTWKLKYKTWEYEPDGQIPVYLKATRVGKEAECTVYIVIEGSYHKKARIKQ